MELDVDISLRALASLADSLAPLSEHELSNCPNSTHNTLAPLSPIGNLAPLSPIGNIAPISPIGDLAPISPIGDLAPISPIGDLSEFSSFSANQNAPFASNVFDRDIHSSSSGSVASNASDPQLPHILNSYNKSDFSSQSLDAFESTQSNALTKFENKQSKMNLLPPAAAAIVKTPKISNKSSLLRVVVPAIGGVAGVAASAAGFWIAQKTLDVTQEVVVTGVMTPVGAVCVAATHHLYGPLAASRVEAGLKITKGLTRVAASTATHTVACASGAVAGLAVVGAFTAAATVGSACVSAGWNCGQVLKTQFNALSSSPNLTLESLSSLQSLSALASQPLLPLQVQEKVQDWAWFALSAAKSFKTRLQWAARADQQTGTSETSALGTPLETGAEPT